MSPRDDSNEISDTLRWKLRALQREVAPGRDLWAGIAPALGPQRVPQRQRSRLAVPVAIAASLLMVVGAIGLWQGTRRSVATPPPATLVQREAEGLTRQYQAALKEFAPISSPGSLQPTFTVLDRDAALIRAALEQAPDSRLLLEQLRRTYAHRLALVQRVAYS
jgi:hypothetical protein